MAIPQSLDDILASRNANGMFSRFLHFPISVNTAPTMGTILSGYRTIQRHPHPFTMPSVGGGLLGLYPTVCNWIANGAAQATNILATEYLLGSLTVNGNTFSSAGSVAMPTKEVMGSSIQTASLLPLVVVTAALTATTPVLTITYTDQDGNTGQTCTMTIPTNAVLNCCYLMVPHLAAGDTGVQAVTNMSISGGSAGSLAVYGLLPINESSVSGAGPFQRSLCAPLLAQPRPVYVIEPGEFINHYWVIDASSGLAHESLVHLAGVGA